MIMGVTLLFIMESNILEFKLSPQGSLMFESLMFQLISSLYVEGLMPDHMMEMSLTTLLAILWIWIYGILFP